MALSACKRTYTTKNIKVVNQITAPKTKAKGKLKQRTPRVLLSVEPVGPKEKIVCSSGSQCPTQT